MPTSAPLLLALLFALGCSPGPPTLAIHQQGEAADPARAGHERMLELLERIRKRTPTRNAYLGERHLRELEEVLAGVDATWNPKTIARLHYDLGLAQLKLGDTDAALASLIHTEEILTKSYPVEEWPPFAERLDYDLGLASMRLGETRNCVARHTSRSCLLPIEGDGVHVDQAGSRAAIPRFRAVLARAPEGSRMQLSARWLLNVAAMTVGEYPDGLTPEERIPPETFAAVEGFPRFEEVAPELGINAFDLCGGAVTDDLDGDGLFDILTSTWDPAGELKLFRNAGDGTFEDRSHAAGLTGILGGLNLVQADADGDGDVDVLVLRGAWLFGRAGKVPNSLLANRGDGTFVDVTFASGLGEEHYPTQTAGWADHDLDGDLDLFVGNEATPAFEFPCQLFRNRGDGTFEDVADEAGVRNLRYTKGVVWGDFDEDRWPDLYVSNLGSPNRLYRNGGDGSFKDVAGKLGVAWPLTSFPVWFWDYDNDGHLDLYVSSYDQGQSGFEDSFRLAPVVVGFLDGDLGAVGGEAPRLYRGDGAGGFEEVTARVGLERVSLPMGANFGDLDNDGFLDFYLGTGYPGFDGLIPNVMFWNRGGERFVDVTTAGGFGHLQKGHGVAFADLDQDGDQDVFEQMGGAYYGDRFGNVLFENPGFDNHWLQVRLIGVASNRSAIGARIRAEFRDGERVRAVHRDVRSGGSFGCNPLAQHLGLGKATRVDVLEVYWPRTDRRQVFRDVGVDVRLEIVEGEEELRRIELEPVEFGGG